MSAIDIQTIKHLSKLTQLELSDQTLSHFATSLTSISNFLDILSQANTDNVTPLLSTLELSETKSPVRGDIITEYNQRETLQAIAPKVEDGFYLVPEVME